jgi:hypothetical protein
MKQVVHAAKRALAVRSSLYRFNWYFYHNM